MKSSWNWEASVEVQVGMNRDVVDMVGQSKVASYEKIKRVIRRSSKCGELSGHTIVSLVVLYRSDIT